MTHVPIKATEDFLQDVANANPAKAIAELVWNGFDAGAQTVRVVFEINALGGLDVVRVQDDGMGINPDNVTVLFGNLGESWKKNAGREGNRVLHGKSGKGRFRAFALGKHVRWNTTFKDHAQGVSFSIEGNSAKLDGFEVTPVKRTPKAKIGTEVVITHLKPELRLSGGNQQKAITGEFAFYLTKYPGVNLIYDGERLDPRSVQIDQTDFRLDDIDLGEGRKISVDFTIIEWEKSLKIQRVYCICDSDGFTLSELGIGQKIHAPGYDFTVHIKSQYFMDLHKENKIDFVESIPTAQTILDAVKEKTLEHFRNLILKGKSEVVERWKEEQIYPYLENSSPTAVEVVERQVFDILAVNIQANLPTFEKANTQDKKFMFRLLSQALRTSPESVQLIVGEVLSLNKKDQEELAQLLQKTTLSSIISTAVTVTNRLDFLVGFGNLVFDRDTKKILLERDQLHKILENEAWIFHERFALAGSEQRLETVLEEHLHHLPDHDGKTEPVIVGEAKRGRLDLILSKVVQPRVGEFDFLVVELKRPSKKIDDGVLEQIKNYAKAVSRDERFHGINTQWEFWVVSNDFEENARIEAEQEGQPKGMIAKYKNRVTVWAKTWSEVINDANTRLNFFQRQLEYDATRESGKGYLSRAHGKYIPSCENNPAEPINAKLADV